MNRFLRILLVTFTLFAGHTGMAQVDPNMQPAPDPSLLADTMNREESQLIEEIIKTRVPPRKEKVQYFSQVTRYGFKNLFANYSYNPKIPYAAQINSNASGFIESYMKIHGKYLEGMKTWGQPYFNLIENILMQYGLPKELKYIAVIESNLKTGAVSNKGAGGPWQFMPGTARQFNLVINNYTDERTDYFKSTHAAAKYLLTLYRQLNDWLLVMAAYNGGPGRVYNAIRQSNSRNFWQLQYYLPEESRTYVKRFIATHYIMEGEAGSGNFAPPAGMNAMAMQTGGGNYLGGDQYALNKPKLSEDEFRSVEVMAVSGKFNSLVIAKNLTMDISEFNRLNPNFDDMLNNIGNYDLRLPAEKMQLFVATKYQILNECVQLLLNGNDVDYKNQTLYPKAPVKKSKKKISR